MKSLKTLDFEYKVFRKISAFFAKKADASLSEINSRIRKAMVSSTTFAEGKKYTFTKYRNFIVIKEIQ